MDTLLPPVSAFQAKLTPHPCLSLWSIFLHSSATPTLILCFPSTCSPLSPCGRHCPSWGISIFTDRHPPSIPAATFYLQDDLYSQSRTMHRKEPAALFPLPLPLPSRWPKAATAGVAARLDRNGQQQCSRHGHLLKAIRLSCGALPKAKNSKNTIAQPWERDREGELTPA